MNDLNVVSISSLDSIVDFSSKPVNKKLNYNIEIILAKGLDKKLLQGIQQTFDREDISYTTKVIESEINDFYEYQDDFYEIDLAELNKFKIEPIYFAREAIISLKSSEKERKIRMTVRPSHLEKQSEDILGFINQIRESNLPYCLNIVPEEIEYGKFKETKQEMYSRKFRKLLSKFKKRYRIGIESLVFEVKKSFEKGYTNKVKMIYRWKKPKELIQKFEENNIPFTLVKKTPFKKNNDLDSKFNGYYMMELTKIKITNDPISGVIYEQFKHSKH